MRPRTKVQPEQVVEVDGGHVAAEQIDRRTDSGHGMRCAERRALARHGRRGCHLPPLQYLYTHTHTPTNKQTNKQSSINIRRNYKRKVRVPVLSRYISSSQRCESLWYPPYNTRCLPHVADPYAKTRSGGGRPVTRGLVHTNVSVRASPVRQTHSAADRTRTGVEHVDVVEDARRAEPAKHAHLSRPQREHNVVAACCRWLTRDHRTKPLPLCLLLKVSNK